MAKPEKVLLTVWYAGLLEKEKPFVMHQLAAFHEQCPDIDVRPIFIPGENYELELFRALATRRAPDVATISLNLMIELQNSQHLRPLDLLSGVDYKDFLHDSWQSAQIKRRRYGLPMRRYGYAPLYQYLAVLRASRAPEAANQLVTFLTQGKWQAEAYDALKWFPTLNSINEKVGVNRRNEIAVRIEPAETLEIMEMVRERAPKLSRTLGGHGLNPYESVGINENGERMGFASALQVPISEEEGKKMLDGDGLIVCGVFVEKAPEYPPGDYVLKLRRDQTFVLVDADGKVTTDKDGAGFKPLNYFKMEAPVTKPMVVTQPLGSYDLGTLDILGYQMDIIFA